MNSHISSHASLPCLLLKFLSLVLKSHLELEWNESLVHANFALLSVGGKEIGARRSSGELETQGDDSGEGSSVRGCTKEVDGEKSASASLETLHPVQLRMQTARRGQPRDAELG